MKFLILIYAIYSLAAVLLYTAISKGKISIKNPAMILTVAFITAMAIRVFYAVQFNAFWDDINCFKQWSEFTFTYGMKDMYSRGEFLDYPPGYIYILFVLQIIRRAMGIEAGSMRYTVLIKSFPCIRDILAGLFIYKVASEKLSPDISVFISMLYVFNPSVIYNSAVWGQIDGWYGFLVVLSLWFASRDNTIGAAVTFGYALLSKVQVFLFGPVFLYYILRRKNIKEFLKAVIAGSLTVYLLSLPFSKSLNPLWLVKLYAGTFGSYKMFSVNGYNVYAMLGLNYKDASGYPVTTVLNIITIAAAMAFSAFVYFKKTRGEREFASAFVLLFVIFTFCTMMHERYLFPLILLSIMAFISSEKPVWLALSVSTGFLSYSNTRLVLLTRYLEYPMTGAKVMLMSRCCVALCIISTAYILWRALADEIMLLQDRNTD